MNNILKLFMVAIIALSIVSFNKETKSTCMNPSGFDIKRGVNLSHWLSQDFGWEPKYTYINENDLRLIDSIGYDHVRIPIDEIEMWDSDGMFVEEAFTNLTNCLEWCSKYNLRAIVDLHTVRAHHFNAENEGIENILWTDADAQDNFISLWKQLSERLKHYPNDRVAYEVLNEAVAPNHEDWNKVMNKAVAAIRKLEPNRVLVIGANRWQMAPNLKYLKLPEKDKNIILSFHIYAPIAFTHYQADWTPFKDYKGSVHYPGQVITNEDYKNYIDQSNSALVSQSEHALGIYNKTRLIEIFQEGIDFAKSKGLQLYCGEFGCLPTVDRKDRMKYYTDIVSAFEENKIAWTNWEYKGDFGLYFWDAKTATSLEPDFELIDVLLKYSDKK